MRAEEEVGAALADDDEVTDLEKPFGDQVKAGGREPGWLSDIEPEPRQDFRPVCLGNQISPGPGVILTDGRMRHQRIFQERVTRFEATGIQYFADRSDDLLTLSPRFEDEIPAVAEIVFAKPDPQRPSGRQYEIERTMIAWFHAPSRGAFQLQASIQTTSKAVVASATNRAESVSETDG